MQAHLWLFQIEVKQGDGALLADVERLQNLLSQQDKEIDETAQHLKDLKDNRDRISRELSEAKCAPATCRSAQASCSCICCALERVL